MDHPPDSAAQGFDLEAFLPYRLAVLASRTSRDFAALYAEFGLTIPEWRVLAHLHRQDGVSVREIQARVGMDKSKVSRAADRLQAAGHVAKTSARADRRLVVLSLTADGQALMQRILPRANAFQADLHARLGPLATPFGQAIDRLLAPSDVPENRR